MSSIPCPEGHCVAPDCGRPLRADTWCPFCDSHWQLVPLDIKRALMKHGRSSATSAIGSARKQTLEYRRALTLALDAIKEHQRGYTGSMSRTITERDLTTK